MGILLNVILYLLTGCASSMSVTGYKGRTVTINCQYKEEDKYKAKYLCERSILGEKIISINTSNVLEHNGRFSLYDSPKGNYFTVIIRELSDEDQEKTYWCAVDKPYDFYTELKLKVLEDDCCTTSVSKVAYLGGSVTIDCKYPRSEESKIKYFCRENYLLCEDLISAHTFNHTRKDRYSLSNTLREGLGIYTVTISRLTEADAGTYWCAMQGTEGSYVSQLTEVHLRMANWNDIKPKEKTWDSGKVAKLHCDYPDSHQENEKFLCKGENPFTCNELINIAQHNDMSKGRLSVRDNKRLRYFTVNIQTVSPNDTGMYWCGSDRTWQPAEYTRIHLTVVEKPTKTKTSTTAALPAASSVSPPANSAAAAVTPTSLESSSSTSSLTSKSAQNGASVYITVSVSLALLLIALTLFITYRCKSSKTRGAHHNREGIHGDADYEDIQERPQQPDSGSAPHSVYATVNFPTNPSDPLHYASVSFHKTPHCADEASVSISTEGDLFLDKTQNGSSSCDYSSVRRPQSTADFTVNQPPTPEELLYPPARGEL